MSGNSTMKLAIKGAFLSTAIVDCSAYGSQMQRVLKAIEGEFPYVTGRYKSRKTKATVIDYTEDYWKIKLTKEKKGKEYKIARDKKLAKHVSASDANALLWRKADNVKMFFPNDLKIENSCISPERMLPKFLKAKAKKLVDRTDENYKKYLTKDEVRSHVDEIFDIGSLSKVEPHRKELVALILGKCDKCQQECERMVDLDFMKAPKYFKFDNQEDETKLKEKETKVLDLLKKLALQQQY